MRLPAGHHHVLHQLPGIAGEREELDAVRLDELAKNRMARDPYAMAVARQAAGDREERLHIAPRADDQDRDRKNGNRALSHRSGFCGSDRTGRSVQEMLPLARHALVDLDPDPTAVDHPHTLDHVAGESAQARMMQPARKEQVTEGHDRVPSLSSLPGKAVGALWKGADPLRRQARWPAQSPSRAQMHAGRSARLTRGTARSAVAGP